MDSILVARERHCEDRVQFIWLTYAKFQEGKSRNQEARQEIIAKVQMKGGDC